MKQTNMTYKSFNDPKPAKADNIHRKDEFGSIDYAFYDRKARSLRSEAFMTLAGKMLKLFVPFFDDKPPNRLPEQNSKNQK